MKKRHLTLELYKPSEMARLMDGRHEIFLGNYWDFHAGCHGTELIMRDGKTIDLKDEWISNRPFGLASLLTKKLGYEPFVVIDRKTPIEC